MPIDIQPIIRSQFRAALSMLTQCIDACPEPHWDTIIGKYPFWHVAYHTLCFVDCYLSPSNEAFTRLVAERASQPFNPQPAGMAELEEEYPSRRFTKQELAHYAALCRDKTDAVLGHESQAILEGP